MKSHHFRNGISVEFLESEGSFAGMGQVHWLGTALRSAAQPAFVSISTPWGVELTDFALTGLEASASTVTLDFSCRSRSGNLMEWMVHEVRNRVVTSGRNQPPRPEPGTGLRLELHEVQRNLDGRDCFGFSYQYHYKSDNHPIYKILDFATWEPSGSAIGNEFWMRNCFVPSRVLFADERQHYSTEWYLPDCQNPSAFQFLPLQTELQGFSFTTGPAGTLVTWSPQVSHIRALYEKKSGQNEIEHWLEHCNDLNSRFATTPMEVLFCPGALTECESFDLYEAIREMVHETLHHELGMRRERVTSYGQIEEWGPANLERYRIEGLPRLLDAGIKTVYLANHFENNLNTYGVANFCCTVDYQVSEKVGPEKLAAFCQAAREGGAHVEMWGNTSISALSVILGNRHGGDSDPNAGRIDFLSDEDSITQVLARSAAPFVRNASNAIEADHYTPLFCALNLRDETVRQYWLKRWGEAARQMGLGGIFLDSSFNLSSDKFHWVQNTCAEFHMGTSDQAHLLGHYRRPGAETPAAILSQFRAHLDLTTAMQELGYAYCNEDLGVFGIHRHGPPLNSRLASMPFWADCIANYDGDALLAAGADPDLIFFTGLAYRQMWSISWDMGNDCLSFNSYAIRHEGDIPRPWHLEVLRAFDRVQGKMYRRKLVGSDAILGVLYGPDAEGNQLYWSFADYALALPETMDVHNELTGEGFTTHCLHASPLAIYRMSPSRHDC